MTSPSTAEDRATAVALLAVTGDRKLVAHEYGVTTRTVTTWARAAGLPPMRPAPHTHCRKGHDMAITRQTRPSGQTLCGECRREWRRSTR